MKHIFLILTFCTTAAFSSAAATLYVDDNAPNDPASIARQKLPCESQ